MDEYRNSKAYSETKGYFATEANDSYSTNRARNSRSIVDSPLYWSSMYQFIETIQVERYWKFVAVIQWKAKFKLLHNTSIMGFNV